MNSVHRQRLWQELQSAQLVSAPEPPDTNVTAPWFVRVMLGIAGWIGALFLLGFVGSAFAMVFRSASAALVVGALCCAAAGLIFRAGRENIFISQFGLALGLAGQILFIYGLHDQFESSKLTLYLIVLLFEVTLTVLLPNFIHRCLTSWGAIAALALCMLQLEVGSILPGLIAASFAALWLTELHWAAHGETLRPVAYSLTLSLLQLQPLFFGRHNDFFFRELSPNLHLSPWLGKGLIAATLLAVVVRLLRQEGVNLTGRAGLTLLAITLLVVVVSFPATGVATALLILIIGYATTNRILVGLGLVAIAGFLSYFYYELQTPLLNKSFLLIASGAALLLLRLATHRAFPAPQEGHDA